MSFLKRLFGVGSQPTSRPPAPQKSVPQEVRIHDAAGKADQERTEALLEAAGNGDLEKVRALLEAQVLLRFQAQLKSEFGLPRRELSFGTTPLHKAAAGGHKAVAELLLANNGFARTRYSASRDMRALMLAVEADADARANVNAEDWSSGMRPLHEAAAHGHKNVAELLLANGANVNAQGMQYGYTPLHFAARHGHKDVAELLLANKADANAKNLGTCSLDSNDTPLHEAAAGGHRDVAELLLANGADVNAKGHNDRTPLHYAARLGRKDVAGLLLASKAEVNAKDRDAMTPLHYAGTLSRKDVAELPLANKDVNAKGVAELLLANKADVNAKDDKGDTPLQAAAKHGDEEVVELLRKYLSPAPLPADHWKCPNCGALLEKGFGGMFGAVVGVATCGACGAKLSQGDVYGGKYDLD